MKELDSLICNMDPITKEQKENFICNVAYLYVNVEYNVHTVKVNTSEYGIVELIFNYS